MTCSRFDEPTPEYAVRTLTALDLNAPVTLFVGENGSGKSTLLEGIAAAAELTSIGGDQVAFDGHALCRGAETWGPDVLAWIDRAMP